MATSTPGSMTVEEAKRLGYLDKPKRNKFGAIKAQCSNGHVHDSGIEAERCDQLHLMQSTGTINDLAVQPTYTLQDGFYWHTRFWAQCEKQGYSKGTWQKPIIYQPDFRYIERGLTIVEDVKAPPYRDKRTGRLIRPTRTAAFEIKRKMLVFKYPDLDFRILTKEDIG